MKTTKNELLEHVKLWRDDYNMTIVPDYGRNENGFTYLISTIRYDGKHRFVKIGRSKEPYRRIHSLMTSCPLPLAGCVAVAGAAIEGYLHGVLADFRINREWFILTDEQIDAVEKEFGFA